MMVNEMFIIVRFNNNKIPVNFHRTVTKRVAFVVVDDDWLTDQPTTTINNNKNNFYTIHLSLLRIIHSFFLFHLQSGYMEIEIWLVSFFVNKKKHARHF